MKLQKNRNKILKHPGKKKASISTILKTDFSKVKEARKLWNILKIKQTKAVNLDFYTM